MRNIIIIALSVFIIGCHSYKNENINADSINEKTKNTSISNLQNTYLDSVGMLNQIGARSFFMVRKNYRGNLKNVLQGLKKPPALYNDLYKDSLMERLNVILKDANLQIENLEEMMPISPSEYRVYDSCFYVSDLSEAINFYERIVFTIAYSGGYINSEQNNFIRLYTDMYLFQYRGIHLDYNRVEDGYYFYDINDIIIKNSKKFCDTIWKSLNPLKELEPDLQNLYKCRCLDGNLDEFNFCE